MIRAILLDIEGTTTPVSFVHRVLFPYARERLAEFLATNPLYPALADVPEPKFDTLLGWMDRDKKITALKAIQGKIWQQGYEQGDLRGELYPDISPALYCWSSAGIQLFVYSSGSVAAQKLLFGHTSEGDLTPLFGAHFDTNIGSKRDTDSYRHIARNIGRQPAEILFLSDAEVELDAASAANLAICQIVRSQDKTLPSSRHPIAHDFNEVSLLFGLPCG